MKTWRSSFIPAFKGDYREAEINKNQPFEGDHGWRCSYELATFNQHSYLLRMRESVKESY